MTMKPLCMCCQFGEPKSGKAVKLHKRAAYNEAACYGGECS